MNFAQLFAAQCYKTDLIDISYSGLRPMAILRPDTVLPVNDFEITHGHGYEVVIPLAVTQKYTDAFQVFGDTMRRGARAMFLFSLEVSRWDAGLRKLFPDYMFTTSWDFVIVTMDLQGMNPLYCRAGFFLPNGKRAVTETVRLYEFKPFLHYSIMISHFILCTFEPAKLGLALQPLGCTYTPQTMIVLPHSYLDYSNLNEVINIPGQLLAACCLGKFGVAPGWRLVAWAKKDYRRVHLKDTIDLALVGPTAQLQSQLASIAPNATQPYFVSENDHIITKITSSNKFSSATITQELRDEARFASRQLHEQMLTFCMCFSLLPPYVVLWIFDWLPGEHLKRHITKLRNIEKALTTVERVRVERYTPKIKR